MFPGSNEPGSPFHDKRVRQAVSMAVNRQFLVKQETQGIGKPWGNWISHENRDALRGDGTELPVPAYDPTKAFVGSYAGTGNSVPSPRRASRFSWLIQLPQGFPIPCVSCLTRNCRLTAMLTAWR